jgi:hypothetical protein
MAGDQRAGTPDQATHLTDVCGDAASQRERAASRWSSSGHGSRNGPASPAPREAARPLNVERHAFGTKTMIVWENARRMGRT